MPLEYSQMEMLIGFGPPINSADAFGLRHGRSSGCMRMEVDWGDIFMEGDWTGFCEGRKDSEQRRENLRRRWEGGRRSDASVWAWIWNVANLSVSRAAPDELGPMGRQRFLILFPGTPTAPGSPATGNLKRVHPTVNATNNYDETLRGPNTKPCINRTYR